MKIAITGTIGSGKSEVSNYLRELGYFVFDCDETNRKLLEKGNAGYEMVKFAFPEAFDEDELDKAKLADIVFNNPERKALLEAIMHPLILQELNKCDGYLLFAEVPLLFEVNWDKYFDRSLLVISNEDDILKRLVEKGMTLDEAKLRISNQMSLKDKMMRANQIIYNNGSLLDLHNNIDEWLKSVC